MILFFRSCFLFSALAALYIPLACGFQTGEGPGTHSDLSARDYYRKGFASCVLDLGAGELGSLYSPVGGNILLLLPLRLLHARMACKAHLHVVPVGKLRAYEITTHPEGVNTYLKV